MEQLVKRRTDLGDNAPIQKALIDIRVIPRPELELVDLQSFSDSWPDRFPESTLESAFSGELHLGDKPSFTSSHSIRGVMFSSPESIVQVQRDGFTFTKLAPYESWDSLLEETKNMWERYKEVAAPDSVRRLAVRYINHFLVPPDGVELHDMFNLHPQSPDGLPAINDFAMQLAMAHPVNPEYRAITTQATQQLPDEVRILLDIDVFTEVDQQPDSLEIWNTLGDLRVFKNDIFFGTLNKEWEKSLL